MDRQNWMTCRFDFMNTEQELKDSPTWPHVYAFALRMEAKLAKNRHKGDRNGWIKDHPWNLVERVLDETVELQQCFTARGRDVVCDDANAAADECADVANFCMMVSDVVLTNSKRDGITSPS